MKSLLAAAATALLLSSCTSPASDDGHTDHEHGSESSAAAHPAGFNDEDVTFATNMIPHHQQAVQMSALVPARSTDPAVIKLAADISAAQGPEIETMKVFLVQWKEGSDTGGQERSDSGNDTGGQERSDSGNDTGGHDGHDMGGMEMHGMVDAATMKKLETLKGNEFDTLWLSSMIGHHEGAIEMAKAEIAGGANVDAKKLAQQIATAQEAEINRMKQVGALTHDG